MNRGMGILSVDLGSEKLERLISANRLEEGMPLVRPAYGEGSIADIPGYVKGSLGISPRRNLPDMMKSSMEEVDHMVFFLLDGFGHSTIKYLLENYGAGNTERFLKESDYTPVTSVFPSTTSTATVTYQTDLHPIEHGIIGYISYLSELGTMGNMITLDPLGMPGRSLLDGGWSVPSIDESGTIYHELESNRISAHLYLPNAIKNSGMTRITGRGSILNPYFTLSQMMTKLRRNLENTGRKTFHYCYISSVDTLSHKVGPYTEDTAMNVESIFHLINEQFINRARPEGRMGIAISADHGHTVIPHQNVSDVRDDVALSGMLRTPVGGDFRAPILRIIEGKADQAMEHLEHAYGEDYLIKTGRDVIAGGIYGKGTVSPENSDRFGDIVMFPKGNAGMFDSALGALDPRMRGFDMIGMHGGLSQEEMIVPFMTRYMNSKK